MNLRNQIAEIYNDIRFIEDQKQELESLSQQREQRIDFLQFQINEIDGIGLQEGEDSSLLDQIRDLKGQNQWITWVQQASDSLANQDGSVIDVLGKLIQSAPDHSEAKVLRSRLEELKVVAEELSFDLQQSASSDIVSAQALEEMEDRLSRIRKLQKKFGASVDEILEQYHSMQNELEKLNHLSETLNSLDERLLQKIDEIKKLSFELRQRRTEGAKLLATEINTELKELNMKGLELTIDVMALDDFQSTGMDRVIFMTKSSRKDEARELAKAASGGELSRILLSLKQVIGANQNPRTFLFDEVDTGVSGPTAEKVGAKLRNLAKFQQVICVTHLPQVASFGNHHFFIEKSVEDDQVEMLVKVLKTKQRVEEIARLISGEKITPASRSHAKELLKQASI